ncbi:MAG: hypothetical protein ACR2P0_17015 [Acidimicrobiales bacterium]
MSTQSRAVRADRGQSVLLLPAGFLILLILGALVLEAAALHLRQRQLDDLADSLANDAAAVGFDIAEFRDSGDVQIDGGRAGDAATVSIEFSNLPDARVVGVRVDSGAVPAVEIELEVNHEYIIGRNLLGGASDTLTATGRAELVRSSP